LDNGVKSIEHGQLADEESVRKMADVGAWWSLQPFLDDEDSNPKPTEKQRREQRAIAEGTLRAFELGQKFNVNAAMGLARVARRTSTSTVKRSARGGSSTPTPTSSPPTPPPW
jgi:hypothetical protein